MVGLTSRVQSQFATKRRPHTGIPIENHPTSTTRSAFWRFAGFCSGPSPAAVRQRCFARRVVLFLPQCFFLFFPHAKVQFRGQKLRITNCRKWARGHGQKAALCLIHNKKSDVCQLISPRMWVGSRQDSSLECGSGQGTTRPLNVVRVKARHFCCLQSPRANVVASCSRVGQEGRAQGVTSFPDTTCEAGPFP